MYKSQIDVWRGYHKEEDIKVVCTEDLDVREKGGDKVGRVVDDVAAFIGLEEFYFAKIVKKVGVVNHGSKPGYDRATKWADYWKEKIDPKLRDKIISFYKEFGEWDEYATICGWESNQAVFV